MENMEPKELVISECVKVSELVRGFVFGSLIFIWGLFYSILMSLYS